VERAGDGREEGAVECVEPVEEKLDAERESEEE
jgi:hypothetical protein